MTGLDMTASNRLRASMHKHSIDPEDLREHVQLLYLTEASRMTETFLLCGGAITGSGTIKGVLAELVKATDAGNR